MATFFVEVIGSVDQSMYGPFPTKETAEAFKANVPSHFDTSVMTEEEKDKSFADFGPLEISPAWDNS